MANLDTLMSTNDKILKIENFMEAFLKKVDKQLADLRDTGLINWKLTYGEKTYSTSEFFKKVTWNDMKYPRAYQVPRIVETF